jgi:acyl-coenzyme A synthetase/AMP-(fatty) acid ligase
MRLQPTFEHPLGTHYARPGGPWDVPSLARLLGPGRHQGTAIVDGDLRLDHAGVDAEVAALAGGLRRRGVGPGDVVTWQLPNWYEAVLLFRACWHLGAIGVPLDHRLGVQEVTQVLELVEPTVRVAAPKVVLAELGSSVMVRDGSGDFEHLLSGPTLPAAAVSGGDVAVGMLTSGSSGQPKVVLHTHRALAYKVQIQQEVHGLHPDDVVLMPAPLSHVSGLLNGVLLPSWSGIRTVLMDRWDPERALTLIEK